MAMAAMPFCPKLSCWEAIDEIWLERAREFCVLSIYEDIITWFTSFVDKHVLNEDVRATVEEGNQHFGGATYCIRFYHCSSIAANKAKLHIEFIFYELQCCMPWKSDLTFFLNVDSNYPEKKATIMKKLDDLQLSKCPTIGPTINTNWVFLPKIELFEFSNDLSNKEKCLIGIVFREECNSELSLYICEEFNWQKEIGKLTSIPSIIMDICSDHWFNHNYWWSNNNKVMFNFNSSKSPIIDCSLDELLKFDVTNTNNPISCEQLNRYLNILYKNLIPELNLTSPEKTVVDLHKGGRFYAYFIIKFHGRIEEIIYRLDSEYNEFKELSRLGVPFVQRTFAKINLTTDQPCPGKIKYLTMCENVQYDIGDYRYFNPDLFCELIGRRYIQQRYNVDFDNLNIMEKFTRRERYYSKTDACYYTRYFYKFDLDFCFSENIDINLINCSIEQNLQLRDFVKFILCGLEQFKHTKFTLTLTQCNITGDYSFLEDCFKTFDKIKFEKMEFSFAQLNSLSHCLQRMENVSFIDCNEISDHGVLTLLEHIDLDRLYFNGNVTCTSLLYVNMALFLMRKENVQHIDSNRLKKVFNNFKNHTKINTLHFVFWKMNYDNLIAKNVDTNEEINYEFFLDDEFNQDEPLDFYDDMYRS